MKQTRSEKATVARQTAIDRRLERNATKAPEPARYPAYVPVKMPHQRAVYDAPGCIIRSPLDEARLA